MTAVAQSKPFIWPSDTNFLPPEKKRKVEALIHETYASDGRGSG